MSEMVKGMGYIGTEPGVLYHMAPPYVTETVTGSELVLKDAVEINMLEIAGKTVQERGKNLMPDTDWLVHDVTFWYVSVDLDPGTYTVSINGTVPGGVIVKKASTMTNIASGQKYFVADERGKYNIYIKTEYVKSKTTGGDKVQLETGTTATAYEPYTNKPSTGYPSDIQGVGVPSGDGYKTELQLSSPDSKNLLPDKKWITFDNTYKYVIATLDPGSYIISANGAVPSGTIVKKADDLALVVYYNNKFTISKSAQYIIYVNRGYAKSDTTGEDKVQLEVGDIITAYEPCTNQSVEIYHREPLQGIGEYTDKIIKKGDIWGIERNTVRWIPTSFIGYGERNGVKACTAFGPKKFRGPVEKAFCNRLPHANNEQYVEHFYHVPNANMAWAYISTAHTIPKEDFEFVSVLMTPEWEPLPAETQEALNSLKPCGTTTYITTTDPLQPEITIQYQKKKGK